MYRGGLSVTFLPRQNTTFYELHRSLSPSFTSPVIIYSGTYTVKLVDVPAASTWHLRAKACNANGCSAFSSQVSAQYWSGPCV